MVNVGLTTYDNVSFYDEGIFSYEDLEEFKSNQSLKQQDDKFYEKKNYEFYKYSRMFPTIEIDHFYYNDEKDNFYVLCDELERLKESAPDGFKFNLKLPRVIMDHLLSKDPEVLEKLFHEMKLFFEGVYEIRNSVSNIVMMFPKEFDYKNHFDLFSGFIEHLPSDHNYLVSFHDREFYTREVFDFLAKSQAKLFKEFNISHLRNIHYLKDFEYIRLYNSEPINYEELDMFANQLKSLIKDSTTLILNLPVKESLYLKERLSD